MNNIIPRKLRSGKNNKFLYYLNNFSKYYLVPDWLYRYRLRSKLKKIKEVTDPEFMERVNYYCKLNNNKSLSDDALLLSKHKYTKDNPTVYFFDTYEYTRWFNENLKWKYCFGDVTFIPKFPAIVKSRPIAGDNENSVVMKLDKVRHFIFVKDKIPFENKMNKAIFRGKVDDKQQRIDFFNKFFTHPMCDLGDTRKNSDSPQEWKTDLISIQDHLKYKFILALEGNDVASNLKWVMSSNSIAIMPRPEYETRFMEGKLIPNHHYIEIKDDFSDLEEKMNYYSTHIDEAQAIISNANEYMRKFKDKKNETLLSLAVLHKYFTYTNLDK